MQEAEQAEIHVKPYKCDHMVDGTQCGRHFGSKAQLQCDKERSKLPRHNWVLMAAMLVCNQRPV